MFVSVCKKIGDAKVLIEPTFDGVWTSDIVQESDTTVAVTYDFSYATSANPKDAGPMSDMFLVPAMNIVYSKSVLIGFDSVGCAGTTKDIFTWSLSSPKNFPVSVYEVMQFVLTYTVSGIFMEKCIGYPECGHSRAADTDR